ncbi:MAG: alpha-amylase family glycosyl hydrolase [Pseudomonadota bacterium]
MRRAVSRALGLAASCSLVACAAEQTLAPESFYGTLEPFASEAVYFVVTDRFVDGDESNNQLSQGEGKTTTFNRPIQLDGEPQANIGYLGGDFRGIVDNADYIAEMGFSALWITPIVDNPDEAFLGGTLPGEGIFTDRGKTGYHGYWGVNFFRVDEHLESEDLTFADLTRQLRDGHNIRVVLDIVCNHGSPAYTNPVEQPKFGEIYNAENELIADHQNLRPSELDPTNPLHTFFSNTPDLAELADVDPYNLEVLDYFVAAYSQWIEQGASAFRIDTIRHITHSGAPSLSASGASTRTSLCSARVLIMTLAKLPSTPTSKTARSVSSIFRARRRWARCSWVMRHTLGCSITCIWTPASIRIHTS